MLATLCLAAVLPQSKLVDRGNYKIHCEIVGQGVPMVAIAGGPGFSGKAVWGIAFGTRSNIKTYLFDQLGTGKSQPKNDNDDSAQWISLDQTIADLESIRRSEKLDKWIVCGQSWGVIVALTYAARHPKNVDQLLLTSIPGIGHDGTILSENLNKFLPPDIDKAVTDIELNVDLTSAEKLERQIMMITPYYFYDPHIGKHVSKLAPPNLFNSKVFIALQKNILNPDAYLSDLKKLPALNIRTTMIQGHQDPCGAAMPFLLKEKFLPNSTIYLQSRSGHFPWIESPDSFFAALYEGLKIEPPTYITEYDTFEEEGPSLIEKQERTKNGWPFNYIPPDNY